MCLQLVGIEERLLQAVPKIQSFMYQEDVELSVFVTVMTRSSYSINK